MSDSEVPKPPDPPDPPLWAKDSLAVKEERLFPDESALRGQRAKNDLNWLRVYGWVVVAMMIVFALLFLASIVAWAWHYVMPVGMAWLTEDQLSKIQSVIFSGSLGGIVSLIAQKQLSK